MLYLVEKLEPDWLENVRIKEPGGRQGSLFNYRLQATQVTKHTTFKLKIDVYMLTRTTVLKLSVYKKLLIH